MTGENYRTGRKTCRSAILFAASPTRTALEANSGLCAKEQTTTRFTHVTTIRIHIQNITQGLYLDMVSETVWNWYKQ
jgi:hypothetical protein